jgi:hypothetical protein
MQNGGWNIDQYSYFWKREEKKSRKRQDKREKDKKGN